MNHSEYQIGDYVSYSAPSYLSSQHMEIKQAAVIGKFEPQYLCSYVERNGQKRLGWFTHSDVELIHERIVR